MRQFYLSALFISLAMVTYGQQLDHVLGQILLKPQDGVEVTGFLENIQSAFLQPDQPIEIVRELGPDLNIWLIRFDHTRIHEILLLRQIRQHPGCAAAQFNHILENRAIPDDPLLDAQWQWINTGQSGGLENADIDADFAWDITTGGVTTAGDTIVVAVIDDGIDLAHDDFAGNLWVNRGEIPDNDIDDDNNGYIDDYHGWNAFSETDDVDGGGHGVNVSGMIGAKGNNGTGVAGINWDIKIMSIVRGSVNEANAIAAYAYALTQRRRYNETQGAEGAYVVATNASWGLNFGQPDEAPLWCAFYDSLGAEGVINIAATMNLSEDVDEVGDLPTACASEFMVAVTATDAFDARTFSAYGIENIDVAAPGDDIFTTRPDNAYGLETGTSFASPIVAGLVALLYAAPCSQLPDLAMSAPEEAARQVRDYIFEGVDTVEALVDELRFGGRVNAFNSLSRLLENCGPCPKPAGLTAEAVTDTQADLVWVNNDSILMNTIRWRRSADTSWITTANVFPPYTIDGLEACTTYEFQVEGICNDTTSGYSNIFRFNTDGCCELPSLIRLEELTESTAYFTWSDVLAAQQYTIVISSPDLGVDDTLEVFGTDYFMAALSPCTDYSFRISTDCDTAVTGFSDAFLFRTFGCGTCTDSLYCEAESDDASSEWIDSISLHTLAFKSGNNGGYASFPDTTTTLQRQRTYDLFIQPGFTFFPFEENYRVWIDFNQDAVFDDTTELIVNTEESIDSALAASFTVPMDAEIGVTRMRIVQRWAGFQADPPQSCGIYSFGEVEDYCIRIDYLDLPCPVAESIDTLRIDFEAAIIGWENVVNSIIFNYRYRQAGAAEWIETLATLDTFAEIADLRSCQEYEFQLLTVCDRDTSSYESYFFTTKCSTSTREVPELAADLNVFPNPFSSAVRYQFTADEAGDYRIRIVNINGQPLYTSEIALRSGDVANDAIRGTWSWPPGMYILSVEQGQRRSVRKLMKFE